MEDLFAFTDWLHRVGCRIFLCCLRELPSLVNSCGGGRYGAVCVDDSNLEQTLLFSFIWRKTDDVVGAVSGVVVTGPTMVAKRVMDSWYQHDGIHHLGNIVTYRLERDDEFLRWAFIAIVVTEREGDFKDLLPSAVSLASYNKFKDAWGTVESKENFLAWLGDITEVSLDAELKLVAHPTPSPYCGFAQNLRKK